MKSAALVAATLVLTASTARADGLVTVGEMVCVPTPAPGSSLWNDAARSERIEIFHERGPLTLATDVSVDFATMGLYTDFTTPPGGTVPAGTNVDVFLIHYDPVTRLESTRVGGGVDMGREILGLIATPTTLDATDDAIGAPGVTFFIDSVGRGIEGSDADVLDWSGSRITVDLYVSSGIDEIRVLTRADDVALDDAGIDSPDAGVSADTGVARRDADTPAGADSGTPGPDGFTFQGAGGCGCDVYGAVEPQAPGLLALLVLLGTVRRRRSPRGSRAERLGLPRRCARTS